MSSTSKRLLAAVLCVLMTLSLFLPAGAASATLGGEHAVVEVPLGDDDVTVAQPAAADQDEPAKLAEAGSCTCSASNPHSGGYVMKYPSEGTVHYYAVAKNDLIKVQTDDNGGVSSVSKSGPLSNDSGTNNNTGTLSFKISSDKVATTGYDQSDIAFKYNNANVKITVHYVDPNACAHEWDEGNVTKAATCTAAGVKTYTCSKCNETKTEEIQALAHNWNGGVETTAPTCYQKGVKTYTCSVGGETRTEDIAATGNHTYGSDGKCTTAGCTAVNPDMCAHSMTTVAHKDATCTEDGVVGGQYCTICGQGEAAAKTVIKATGHDWKADGTCANGCGEVKNTSFLAAAGDLESAYALWPIDSAVSKYEAYIIDSSNKETKVDDDLIRQYSNYMRVDVLGLKAGSYKIKVKDNKGGEMTTGTLTVKAHDRTGFGFVNGSSSGAYNDDGTLKANAKVVYVTNATFKTVQVTVKNAKGADVTFTGVQEIVNNSGVAKEAPGTPVCIRVLGTIDTTGFPKGDWGSGAEGLQVKGNNAGENKNLTIEGVGNDAAFNGFGMLIRNCKNVEVRNIGLFNFADDGISIDTGNDHLWIHNNDFFYGGVGSDADQAKGDGSLDSKGIQYATESYNHFWDSGKCNLMGMGGGKDHYVTFHHNWFDHSDSRHPRIREAEVHIYNNFFDTNAKYGVGSAVGAPVFVEGNYFLNCKYPMITGNMGSEQGQILSGEAGGVIKSWNNTIVGEKSFYTYQEDPTNFDAYVATSRNEVIPSTVQAKGGTYNNFDTKMDLGVTAAQIESPEEAMKTVTRWAGRVQGGDFQYEFDEETQHWSAGDKIAAGVISELKSLVSNYKGTLVKVGGTVDASKVKTDEHVCETGRWVVTEAPSGDSKGVKTQYCVICGEEMRTAEVGETTAGGSGEKNTLTYSHFKESKHVDNYAVTQGDLDKLYGDETATANSGYFKVVGNKVLLRATKSGSSALTCIQLPKGGGSGISFTVAHAPATVKVDFSSTSNGQKSTLVMKNSAGALVADENGATSAANNKGLNSPTTVTYTLETAGTYTVSASDANSDSDYNVRLLTLSVTEAEVPCEHETTTHHAAVAATCTKDGSKEYWTCNSCKKNFADAACTTRITDITVESTGHKWGEWVVSADGKTQTRTCSVCKTTETDDVGGGGDEPDDPPAAVDTTGLEAAITAAEKLTAVKVDTAAANVDKGTSWVTKSVMDALKSAIATAKALDTTKADQTAVDAAAKTLNKAVDTFVDAVQEGTKESGGTSTGSVHTFESKTLTKAAAGSTASGAYAGDSYFTLVPSSKAKYDESSKQWGESFGDNAYDPSGDGAQSKVVRFNMGGASTKDGPGIKFTTTADNAKVQIWWVQGGGDTEQKDSSGNKNGEFKDVGIRQIAVLKASDASKVAASELAHTSSTPSGTDAGRVKANDPEYTELTIPTAGEYMVGSLEGSNYIFKIVVTEGASGSTTPTVDKSALTKAIEDATAAIAVPAVSTNGKDVDPSAKWVTQAEKDTFQAAINAAKAAKLTAASAADVTAAVDTLKAAAAAFEAAQENGTKGQSGIAVTKITISGSGTVTVGNTITLTATVKPDDATNKAVTWTSSNEKVATVDANGKVTGVAAGTATITATAKDGSGVKDTWNVSVSTASSPSSSPSGGGGGSKKPSGGDEPTTEPTTPAMGFVDVKSGDWFYDVVNKAFNKGLMKGTDATHFAPDATTTRAMVMTILARLNGENTEGGETWYTKGMAWAMETGISDGTAPLSQVTREQLAVMLYRYANPKVLDKSDALGQFTDVASISDWAVEALQWAVKVGVINGKGNGTLDPQGPATRSQVCAMVIRFVELDK